MHLTTGPGLTSRAYQAGFASRNIWIPSRLTPQSNARTLCTGAKHLSTPLQPVPRQVPISSQYHASLTGTTVCGYGLCGRGWNCQLPLPLSSRQCGRSRFHCRSSQFGRAQYLLLLTRNLDAQLGGNGALSGATLAGTVSRMYWTAAVGTSYQPKGIKSSPAHSRVKNPIFVQS
jgi:hypothetical protein